MKTTKIMISIIFFLVLFISAVNVNATPTVEDITTQPAQPTPLSTIKVIATITGENIISVNLTVAECDESLCYVSHSNIVMSLNEDSKYEAELTLKDDRNRADHIQYQFIINDNGTEYTFSDDSWKTYFLITNNNDNQNTDNNDNTPGFELIILLVAVFISLIFLKRKR